MRTTLEIPDPLFREVKARAAQSGLKLKELLTRYIEAGLKAPDVQSVKPRTKRAPLPTFREPTGVPHRAYSNAELQEILDQEDLEQLKRAWGMTDEAP
jgi:hypothetical protein